MKILTTFIQDKLLIIFKGISEKLAFLTVCVSYGKSIFIEFIYSCHILTFPGAYKNITAELKKYHKPYNKCHEDNNGNIYNCFLFAFFLHLIDDGRGLR